MDQRVIQFLVDGYSALYRRQVAWAAQWNLRNPGASARWKTLNPEKYAAQLQRAAARRAHRNQLLAERQGPPVELFKRTRDLAKKAAYAREWKRRPENYERVKAKSRRPAEAPPQPYTWDLETWTYFIGLLVSELGAQRAKYRPSLYRELPPERKKVLRDARRRWRQANPDRVRDTKRDERRRRRLQRRPGDLILSSLRHRLSDTVRKKGLSKADRTMNLVGCPLPDLKAQLEAGFRDGMSWDNYGSHWHIDHKKPCALFDFTNPDHQRECFHHTNLQPLLAFENIAKGAKYND